MPRPIRRIVPKILALRLYGTMHRYHNPNSSGKCNAVGKCSAYENAPEEKCLTSLWGG